MTLLDPWPLRAAQRGGRTAPNQPQTRMDAQSDVVAGVLPEPEINLPRAGAKALDEYLEWCREHAIVPDVGGAFAYAIRAGAEIAASPAMPQWLPIESAPRDGTDFYALIDGAPYLASFDEHGRFTRVTHANIAAGPSYRLHRVDGKELREMIKESAPAQFEKVNMIWQSGFAHEPTHWMPLPQPPKEQT